MVQLTFVNTATEACFGLQDLSDTVHGAGGK